MKKKYNSKKEIPFEGLLEWDEEASSFLKIDSINNLKDIENLKI